jgi:hypothetical protein
MSATFWPISYNELNSKQKESYNFQIVSAILADFGFVTIRMSSDWGGADFIAQHKDGKFLKVQLKSRLTFSKKYLGKDKELYICFKDMDRWYLYPHDEMLKQNLDRKYIGKKFWDEHEDYSNPKPSKGQTQLLEAYELKPGQAISL